MLLGFVERFAQKTNHPIHHPRGSDDVRACLCLRQGRPAQVFQGGIVVHHALVSPLFQDDAAVAVGRVLAEAAVSRHHQIRHGLLDCANGTLDDALRMPCLASNGILSLGQPKQDDRRDAESGDHLGLTGKLVDREMELSRQRRNLATHPLARAHEERKDQVVGRERGLANHSTQSFGSAQSPGPVFWERHAIGLLWVSVRS